MSSAYEGHLAQHFAATPIGDPVDVHPAGHVLSLGIASVPLDVARSRGRDVELADQIARESENLAS